MKTASGHLSEFFKFDLSGCPHAWAPKPVVLASRARVGSHQWPVLRVCTRAARTLAHRHTTDLYSCARAPRNPAQVSTLACRGISHYIWARVRALCRAAAFVRRSLAAHQRTGRPQKTIGPRGCDRHRGSMVSHWRASASYFEEHGAAVAIRSHRVREAAHSPGMYWGPVYDAAPLDIS